MPHNSQSNGEIFSPVITPFGPDLAPDARRLAAHCRWLIDNGVGLAVFGTNSEANSLSLAEKQRLIDHLAAAGLPCERMMPGTGLCSIEETVALTRHALDHGCSRVLMLPPFYYKGVSDDGLFRYYSEVIERVGEARFRLYLYHIPPVAQVPLGPELIARLLRAYPDTIAGIKDSSGDWANTQTLLQEFSSAGFRVFAGSERFLLDTLRGGGAGCISATANVNPKAIARLAQTWQESDADEQQAELTRVREIFAIAPVLIPALKAATAYFSGDDAWMRVRPPLVEIDEANRTRLLSALEEAGFAMPNLPA